MIAYDPLIIINEKLRIISDSQQLAIHQINVLLNEIIIQTKEQSEIRKDYCEICLVRNAKFDGHHIGGKYNDFRQITACIPCHHILTEKQKLDARIWTPNNPPYLKAAFFVRGLYDVLILMAYKQNNSLYSQIADSLLDTVYSIQRSAQN